MFSRVRLPETCVAILLLALTVAASANAATASVSYTYDQLGRVATALYDNGTCIAYSYDASGNRTAQTNTTAGAPETPSWGSGVWGCFSWTAAQPAEPTPPGGQGLSVSTALPGGRPPLVDVDYRVGRKVGARAIGVPGAQ
jgi:YD repeat-containing protein